MSVFDQMLEKYNIVTENERRNATCEIMQEIALAGLYRGGFFKKAAFYGGTCLRIFHGMPRFSEDMDFSLLVAEDSFNLENYFPAIITEFKALGKEVFLTKKTKKNFGNIESAFLKQGTATYDLAFNTEKSIKIKLEVDINPPLHFSTEYNLLLHPFSFMTRCFTLPDLFAGKMHALIFRNWKSRVKGRDWYDFEWYVRNGIELNMNHFKARVKQLNNMDMDQELLYELLMERLQNTDIEMVKRDVWPFIKDTKALDIWSNDYFIQLAKMIKIKSNAV